MQTNELMKELIEKINGYEVPNEQFKAVFAFDERVSPVPIDRVYIAFSSGGVKVNFFEDENEETCKRTNVTIELSFFASPKKSAKELYALCDTIMDRLMLDYAGMMTDYHTDVLLTDDNLRLLKLPVSMSFEYELCPAYEIGGDKMKPFADFLCKTHVINSVVHLSQSEKEYLAMPVFCGNYYGNGEERRKIELPFEPSAVLVFKNAGVPFAEENGKSQSFFAIAAGNRGMKGLSIDGSGFVLQSGEDVSSNGVFPCLNGLGSGYGYVALR